MDFNLYAEKQVLAPKVALPVSSPLLYCTHNLL